ncbi:hypothetical protein BGZ82_008541 [Podila clonocystis]|nr:hypothetical protein BGZ82_008541 [Podila clonocystis]
MFIVIILFLLVIRIKDRRKFSFTRVLLKAILSKQNFDLFLLWISLTGFAIQILYNILFSSVMIRLDALTGEISNSLLYVVVVFGYLSYCWTSLVLTNVIYTLVAGVSAAHYLPSKAYEGSVLEILNRVTWTKSLGSICYGSSTPLGPISQLFRTSWKDIKSSAYKHALYNVAVYGMDYDSAANDIRTRMAELQVSGLLEHCVVTQLLFYNAVSCGAIGAYIGYSLERTSLHVVASGALGSMQAVLTVGAAADAALAAVFVAMAHDPEGFVTSNPRLVKLVEELHWENIGEPGAALEDMTVQPNINSI